MNKKNTNIDDLIKKTALAIGLTGASFMTACNFSPEENEIKAVYGPPEYMEEEAEPVSEEVPIESDEVTTDEEVSENADDEEMNSSEQSDDNNAEDEKVIPRTAEEDMIPELNEPRCIYGPPEMMLENANKEQ